MKNKSITFLLSFLMIINSLSFSQNYDTIYGAGLLNTNVPFVDLEITPIEMEAIVPDTVYYANSGDAASFFFSQEFNDPPNGLPVYIDIHESIDEIDLLAPVIFVSRTNMLTIHSKSKMNGLFRIYDINGSLLQESKINSTEIKKDLNKYQGKIFIIELELNNKRYVDKIIASSNSSKKLTLTDKSILKSANEHFATYKVKYEKEGYFPDSTELLIGEEFSVYNFFIVPFPPPNLDINFTIYNLDDERINNTIVNFDQVGGPHEITAIADENGELTIENLIAGEDYYVEIGGVNAYKAWGSTSINDLIYSVPEEEELLEGDTLINRNITLYPDQVIANGETVSLSAYYNRIVFGNYNIMLSLYNHTNFWKDPNFGSTGLNAMNQWDNEFYALTGIQSVNSNTQFDADSFMDDFDPYTIDESIVGTNILQGNNNTYDELHYYMPNTNEPVIVGADRFEVSLSDRASYFKEKLRTLGYLEGGSGFMAGTPQDITNTEAGMVGTNYLMGVARFQNEQHNFEPIMGMIYLKEEMDGKKTSTTSNTNPVLFISDKVE